MNVGGILEWPTSMQLRGIGRGSDAAAPRMTKELVLVVCRVSLEGRQRARDGGEKGRVEWYE
jgi:hypothetical protein